MNYFSEHIPWTAGVNVFSGVRESGLRDEHADMRVAHGDAMVAHNRRPEYVWVWRKKKRVFNNWSGSNNFFVVKACTHMRVRVQQLNRFEFEYKRMLVPD
jgi:hypothetical protein